MWFLLHLHIINEKSNDISAWCSTVFLFLGNIPIENYSMDIINEITPYVARIKQIQIRFLDRYTLLSTSSIMIQKSIACTSIWNRQESLQFVWYSSTTEDIMFFQILLIYLSVYLSRNQSSVKSYTTGLFENVLGASKQNVEI